MTTTHHAVLQNTDEWLSLRRGKLTASEMHLIMTPGTGKPASNDKSRAHLYELLAQRLTDVVEPRFYSDDMERGHDDEVRARALYREKYAPVEEVGFITREWDWGTIGYSPDGLVGDDGTLEVKGPRNYNHLSTLLGGVPDKHVLQIQTGLLVSRRDWCDFISYSGGLPMVVYRVKADWEIQLRIVQAAREFEGALARAMVLYHERVDGFGWHMTEKSVEQEFAATENE